MEHDLDGSMWNLLVDRKCKACGLLENDMTNDCLGEPINRFWLLAFQEEICDYVNGEWIDWMGRSVDNNIQILRQRQADYIRHKEAEQVRPSHLKRKMEMEDELLTHSKYRGLNPRPFD